MAERANIRRRLYGTKMSHLMRFRHSQGSVTSRDRRLSDTPDPPPPYTPLSSLDDNRIRLLDLQPGSDNEQLRGRLVTVDLSSNPRYCAISCAWGHSRSGNVIWLDGRCVLLHDNIWTILKRLRQIGYGSPLWVDEICINQQDFHERISQMLLMHNIYSCAQIVICCLDEQRWTFGTGRRDDETGVSQLIWTHYWKRLWIVQELLLAKNVVVISGSDGEMILRKYPSQRPLKYSKNLRSLHPHFPKLMDRKLYTLLPPLWNSAGAAEAGSFGQTDGTKDFHTGTSAKNWSTFSSANQESFPSYLAFCSRTVLRDRTRSPSCVQEEQQPKRNTLPLGGDIRGKRSDDFDQPLQDRDSREYQLTVALLACFMYCVGESYEAKRLSLKTQRYLTQAGHRGTKIPYGRSEASQEREVTTSELKPRNALSSLEWNLFYAREPVASQLQRMPSWVPDWRSDPKKKIPQVVSSLGPELESRTCQPSTAAPYAKWPLPPVESNQQQFGPQQPDCRDLSRYDLSDHLLSSSSSVQQASRTRSHSASPPATNGEQSCSTVSSDFEGADVESNTSPDSSVSESELSFTGELYSNDGLDEDFESPTATERLFVAIEVEGLLRIFHKYRQQQQQGTVPFRRCVDPNGASTSSHSSEHASLGGTGHTSPQDISRSKRPWTQSEGDDDHDQDPNGRRRKFALRERRYNSDLKLYACPYTKYDPTRYSPCNFREKHYRHCSSSYSTNIARLKQHMYRVHKRPEHYCGRCFAEFSCHQHLENHIRSQSPCNVVGSPFDEKMTQDQATLIKRRSQRQSPSDAWFFIYKTLFPLSPLPPSPYSEGTATSNARRFGELYDSQLDRIRQSFRSQVARRMPSLAERERDVLDSILEECLGRLDLEENHSSHEADLDATTIEATIFPSAPTSPDAAAGLYQGNRRHNETETALHQRHGAAATLPSEAAHRNTEMNAIFEPQPVSSGSLPPVYSNIGDDFINWDNLGLFGSEGA